MNQLIILHPGPGGIPVTRVFLKPHVSIGRAPQNDLSFEGAGASLPSRHHALIEWVGENEPRITDLGSTNGTTVNGEPLQFARNLSQGDHVVLGGGAAFHVYWGEGEALPVPRGAAAAGLFPLVFDPAMARRFSVIEKVAESAHGTLWRACAGGRGDWVAIKVLRLDEAISGTPQEIADKHRRQVERFRREGEILCAFGREADAHIVRAHETGGDAAGMYYIIMDYIEGVPLSRIVLDRHPIPSASLAAWFHDVAVTLDAAHRFSWKGAGASDSHGIIHRDVRPSNILIKSGSEQALLCDFGIAAVLEGGLHLTNPQDRLSHLHHTPPEAFFERMIGPSLDLWGLAVSFYLAATGMVFPYEGRKAESLQGNIERGRIRRLAKVRYDLHPRLIDLVESSLQHDPARRPTMREWVVTLRRHLRQGQGGR